MIFINYAVNEQSIMKRSLVFGVGINDAKYKVQPRINGKQLCCPYYKKWKSFIIPYTKATEHK